MCDFSGCRGFAARRDDVEREAEGRYRRGGSRRRRRHVKAADSMSGSSRFARDLDAGAARQRQRLLEPVAAVPVGARVQPDHRRARSVGLDRFHLQRDVRRHLVRAERERLHVLVDACG